MIDIVPSLLANIQRDFNESIRSNVKLLQIQEMIANGTATYEQAYDYAKEVGGALAASFQKYLNSDVLPDGHMYYNIANRILNPTLNRNYIIVAAVSVEIQEILNRKAGLGLRGIRPQLNQMRINSIIEKVVSEEVFDDVAWMLEEPIVNFTRSVVDDTIETNADFQYQAGLYPRIIRIAKGSEVCEWCRSLEGTYKYPDVPRDVYRRHDRCECIVEYDPGDAKRQNIWSKEWRSL